MPKGAPISNVYVLYTGGTFGMKKDEALPGQPLAPMPLSELKSVIAGNKTKASERMESISLPEGLADGVDVTIDSFEPHELIDSSNMKPKDWVRIAQRIYKNYDKFDGFVVIQGTDTLAYTASALSFIFENLAKPVVITGSLLPLVNPRTDANLNLGHSVMVAGYKSTNLPLIPEVVVVFADKILRGCRTRKMSASSWTGFESPNAALLGQIGGQVRIFENQIRPSPEPGLDLELNDKLVEEVLDISLFPGLRASHLARILNLREENVDKNTGKSDLPLKGIVMRTYGAGNAPEDQEFLDVLDEAVRATKTIVNITQCPEGAVEMGRYRASMGLLDRGVVSGLDMTPEAALTKLMVTLGSKTADQAPLQMQVNQRGEQSFNLFDINFTPAAELGGLTGFKRNYNLNALPDRRFKPSRLSSASLRIKSLKLRNTKNEGLEEDNVLVFLNAPNVVIDDARNSDTGELDHRRLIYVAAMPIGMSRGVDIIEELPTDKIRSIAGDSDLVLTLLSENGSEIGFANLSMALFTQS